MKIWPHYDYAEINNEVLRWSEHPTAFDSLNIIMRKSQHNIKAYYKTVQITESHLKSKNFFKWKLLLRLSKLRSRINSKFYSYKDEIRNCILK